MDCYAALFLQDRVLHIESARHEAGRKGGLKNVKTILHFLDEYLEEVVMTILLILMAVIMGVQVLSRYAFGMSLSWSEEVTRYLFIWSAFISVSLCTRKCISIKIDQFVKMFSMRGRALFNIVNLAIQFVFFVYLVPYAWRYLMTTIESGQVSPACGIPMYYIQSAPLICFALCAFRIAQRWILEWRSFLQGEEKKQ